MLRGHVVLRVPGEVLAVAADRHGVERQPGVARLALVAEHGHAALLEPVEQRIEAGVVDHDRAAVGIAMLHADVFPELDGHCALGQGRVESLLHPGEPAGLVAAGGVEGGGEGDAVGIGARERCRVALLHGDRREVAVVDVDRQDAEAVLLRLRGEHRHVAVQVHMRVHLLDGGEVTLRVAGRGGLAGGRGKQESAGGCEQADHRQAPVALHRCWRVASALAASGDPASRAA